MTKKILIVDDDPLMPKALRLHLRRAGFETVICANGQEAKEYLQTEVPDAATFDLMMPKVDGRALLKWLREEKKSSIPVILITAAKDKEDVNDDLKALATKVLFKPVRAEEIIGIIKELCPSD